MKWFRFKTKEERIQAKLLKKQQKEEKKLLKIKLQKEKDEKREQELQKAKEEKERKRLEQEKLKKKTIRLTPEQYEKAKEEFDAKITELFTKNRITLKELLITKEGNINQPLVNKVQEEITNNINDTLLEYTDKTRPTIIVKPFLPNTGLKKLLEGKHAKKLKEPLLFLMRSNGTMEIMEGVKAGSFITQEKTAQKELQSGQIKQQLLELTPSKLQSLHYNGQYFRTWVAHENDAIPYPHETVHDSKILYDLIKRYTLSWKDFKEQTTKLNIKWIFWGICGLVILVTIGYTTGFIPKMLAPTPQMVTTAAENITTMVTKVGP